jgi:hypothetical protein
VKKIISAIALAGIGFVSLASPARADERRPDRDRVHYTAPVVRALPARAVGPRAETTAYRHDRWEAERARERRLLDERRAAFYAHSNGDRRAQARFEAWYSARCSDLAHGIRIEIG